MASPGLPSPVRGLLPALGHEPVWFVGGGVRDLLLGRDTRDFDFAVQGDGLALGRRLANTLGADYYTLDSTRGTGRLLLTTGDGERSTFDFAALRGRDIVEDLTRRDFTVNAMAIALSTPEGVPLGPDGPTGPVIDPLGGASDLREKRLRTCSATSVADDPIRALRAVRLGVEFGLRMDPETVAQIRRVRASLSEVSPERLRDELFRLLDGRQPGAGLRLLDQLGLADEVVPEIAPLRGLAQPPPHAFDAYGHSVATVEHLANLAALLTGRSGKTEAGDLTEASALLHLGPYQDRMAAYLDFSPSFGRRRRSLLLWTALLHDGGKANSRTFDTNGRIRFLGHETIGSRIAVEACRRLRLSAAETAEVEMTVLHHMRPEWLEAEAGPTRRAVYRFFRATESVGPSVILLSLADLHARTVPPVPAEAWERRGRLAARLLQAWFEQRESVVSPTPLLSGEEIIRLCGLRPGPEVGRIVEALREAQAEGRVETREEAVRFVTESRPTADGGEAS